MCLTCSSGDHSVFASSLAAGRAGQRIPCAGRAVLVPCPLFGGIPYLLAAWSCHAACRRMARHSHWGARPIHCDSRRGHIGLRAREDPAVESVDGCERGEQQVSTPLDRATRSIRATSGEARYRTIAKGGHTAVWRAATRALGIVGRWLTPFKAGRRNGRSFGPPRLGEAIGANRRAAAVARLACGCGAPNLRLAPPRRLVPAPPTPPLYDTSGSVRAQQ